MAEKKACEQCHRIVLASEDKCIGCGSQKFSEVIKGRALVFNHSKSALAKALQIEENGEYALKVR